MFLDYSNKTEDDLKRQQMFLDEKIISLNI